VNTKGTILAWMLDPGTRKEIFVETPGLLAAGGALLPLAVSAFEKSHAAAGILAALGAGATAAALRVREVPIVPEPLPEGHEGYDLATRLLRGSTVEEERKSIFCGTLDELPGRPPLLTPSRRFTEHAAVFGPTGSSKTALFLCSWAKQLLAQGNTSVIVCMFKRDPAAFSDLCEEAARLGIPVKYLTLDRRRATFLFNPLLDPAFREMAPEDRSEMLLAASGMLKSEAHGEGHWSDQNEKLFRTLFMGLPGLDSFRKYHRALEDRAVRRRLGISTKQLERSSHAATILEKLALRGAINVTPEDPVAPSLLRHAITSHDPIRSRQLIILNVESLLSPTTSRLVARIYQRLVIHALHQWEGPRVENLFMFFDDCRPLIEQSLEEPLRNARELRFGQIFFTQNLTDFRNNDCDMVPSILANTSIKAFTEVKDFEAARYISAASGEVIRTLGGEGKSVTEGPAGTSEGKSTHRREVVVPRIGPEEFKRLNGRRGKAIIEVSRPEDIGQTKLEFPAFVSLPFTISKEEYDRLRNTPWPEPNGVGTVRGGDLTFAPERAPAPDETPTEQQPERRKKRRRPPKPTDPEEKQRADALAEALRRMRGEG
jgi:type IV secretory pathway TraG/TraD family ATPase VirD4